MPIRRRWWWRRPRCRPRSLWGCRSAASRWPRRACAPKSNAAYLGIERALKDVEQGKTLEVPQHLKDASYPGAERLDRGKGYKYAHDYTDHHVAQDYIPETRRYYEPTNLGFEKTIKAWLDRLEKTSNPANSPSKSP
jgi:replication-associated recombination protein RarA